MLYHGEGGEQDLPLARHWLELAEKQGHAKAQHKLAVLYGAKQKKDSTQVNHWFGQATKQANAPYQNIIDKIKEPVSKCLRAVRKALL